MVCRADKSIKWHWDWIVTMNKQQTGKVANLAGQNAELQVAADYIRRGHRLSATRGFVAQIP